MKQAKDFDNTLVSLQQVPTSVANRGVSAVSYGGLPMAVVLPANADEVHHTHFLWWLMCVGSSEDGLPQKAVVTWVLSLMVTLYQGLFVDLVGTHMTVTTLSANELNALEVWYKTCQGLYNSKDPDSLDILLSIVDDCQIDGIGFPPAFETDRANPDFDPLMAYAYLSCVCFTIAKDAAVNFAALETRRPAAFLQKYKWSAEDAPMLGGALAISRTMNTLISGAFMRIPGPRAALFNYLTQVSEKDLRAEDEAAFLNIRLMKWVDLQHVPIITQFLRAYPEVYGFAPLQGEIAQFRAAIVALIQACPVKMDGRGKPMRDKNGDPIRYTYMMPYIKIFKGDKGDVAKRNTMPRLITVAVRQLSKTIVTLGAYTAPPDTTGIFRDWEEYRNSAHDSDLSDTDSETDSDLYE